MDLSIYINSIKSFSILKNLKYPWDITDRAEEIIEKLIKSLNAEFRIEGKIAVHKSSTVEPYVTLKGPVVVGENCLIASGAYLRGGVFLERGVKIGPSCEIKSSFVFAHTALAHFNYVGNSLIGSNVNLEAGSVIANHFNEREDKTIRVKIERQEIVASTNKFGALVGDDSKIGANAVLSPGTILVPKSVVGRLELVKGI